MKKVWIKMTIGLLTLALLAGSAACGKTQKGETTAPSETTAAQTTEAQTAEAQTAEADEGTVPQTESVDTSALSEEAETTEASSAPQTKAQAIALVNTAVNAVKSGKAGFRKVYKRDAAGDITGLPGWLKDIIHKDETSSSAKGADCTDTFPAAGYSWSSRLRESDVVSYTVKEENGYTVIRLNLGKEHNPTPGETSSYGRCMSVVTVDSAESIPGISNVSMDYHDGYLQAKIDAETGRVVECTFSAAADVSAKVTIIGDISVKNIVSTETFTDFVW